MITISVSDGVSAFQDITRKSRGDTETGRWEVASLCLVLMLSLMLGEFMMFMMLS